LEDIDIDLRILKWILNKLNVRVKIELTCLRIGGIKTVVMPLGFIKSENFLTS
jgi:hypothetical protein